MWPDADKFLKCFLKNLFPPVDFAFFFGACSPADSTEHGNGYQQLQSYIVLTLPNPVFSQKEASARHEACIVIT